MRKKLFLLLPILMIILAGCGQQSSKNPDIYQIPNQGQCFNNSECPQGYKCKQDNGSLAMWCIKDNQTATSTSCASENETIGAQGMPENCCSGLKAMGGWPSGYTGDCSLPPPPTGLSICSKCGDNICNINTGENKCNCSEDCK